ncbi:hypothetical protein DFH11DRAFT_959104 [Phellopilus nigrolimitatus]|nr:hypothetical protein DFH11DRAFT_959104 [Phellopilus nigrolimitatus]
MLEVGPLVLWSQTLQGFCGCICGSVPLALLFSLFTQSVQLLRIIQFWIEVERGRPPHWYRVYLSGLESRQLSGFHPRGAGKDNGNISKYIV